MKWLQTTWLVMILLVSGSALAQGPDASDAKARTYFAAGTTHYQAGRYLEAQAAFAAGFELSHKPGFLWNMAECARLLGNRERAIELYKRYLVEAPTGPQRGDVEQRLRTLEPNPAPAPVAPSPAPVAPALAPAAALPPPLAPRAEAAPEAARSDPNGGADAKPVYARWWFWTGAGAVATAAIVTAVVLSSGGSSAPQTSGVKGPTIDWRAR